MDRNMEMLELQRIAIQVDLDSKKTQAERNKAGQFATPILLAQDIIRHAAKFSSIGEPIRFLDPAIGTGAFYSALRNVYPHDQVAEALGFEIDPHYGHPAGSLWQELGLDTKIEDFTRSNPDRLFNLLICNPPYVRHHHLAADEKSRLQGVTLQRSGMRLNGLAGLYCYFIGVAHAWLAKGAISGWLIPSEFMDVNYGSALKSYLLEQVTLLHVHRFDPSDVQFPDALVSSSVVWFRNEKPPHNHAVRFSFGASLAEPSQLRDILAKDLACEAKWTRFPGANVRSRLAGPFLSDFFRIKRGIATGNNNFFILSEDQIAAHALPREAFRPILPSPRFLRADEVEADSSGDPCLANPKFLLDTRLSEAEIQKKWPSLWSYLDDGKKNKFDKTYLCRHRAPWYSQEERPPAPIICTYIGRSDSKNGRPFRFILNKSRATVPNVYLAMYPLGSLARHMSQDSDLLLKVWQVLNRLTIEQLLGEGRVYGGGLYKLEPKELGNVSANDIACLLPIESMPMRQAELLGLISVG